jgi:predicted NACHT family NTPase
MVKSLRASLEGCGKAKSVFSRKGKTQEYLAGSVSCTRQVVINFFARKPVATQLFQQICTELDLNWTEIAELEEGIQPSIPDAELNALVLEVRRKVSASIQKRCGTMRVLDMTRPITIDSIYTSVNILEKISRNQRRSVEELLEGYEFENFDRFFLGKVKKERIPALEAVERHDKLMILGKPGAGKTTFLKWLALQCNEGKVHVDRVPFFIRLEEFAGTEGQPDLFGFIVKQLMEYGVDNGEKVGARILEAGRAIVLLDGLDEVKVQDHDRVFKTIRQTEENFYASQFVITCRIAAKEYIFDQFTEVEVADFNNDQIAEFARKWFQHKDPIKAEKLPTELQHFPRLQELATNPLLLTLLCFVFEEKGRFSANRSEFYEESLDLLLGKWDNMQTIKGEEIYRQLSIKRKEDLLSRVAFSTFKSNDYFFKQKIIEGQIQKYIQNLPNASTETEILELDSEAVLNSIVAHHGLLVERARGIYSFSHLTFQEYFTARWFKEKADGDFGELIGRITDSRWREVFLLTVEMLENPDKLLQWMKQEIDNCFSQDQDLQRLLDWAEKKSCSTKNHYKPAAVRAYYLELDTAITSALGIDMDRNLAFILDVAKELDSALAEDVNSALAKDLNSDLDIARVSAQAYTLHLLTDYPFDHDFSNDDDFSDNHASFICALDCAIDTESIDLKKSLQQLKDQLPDLSSTKPNDFANWWIVNHWVWHEQLDNIMQEHCNIGHFLCKKAKNFQKYYEANKLLLDCLNTDCSVSPEIRAEIESTLLLPSI